MSRRGSGRISDSLGDFWRDIKKMRKERRKRLGVPCQGCNIKEPKRIPSILLPGQKCKVCGYRDQRKRED